MMLNSNIASQVVSKFALKQFLFVVCCCTPAPCTPPAFLPSQHIVAMVREREEEVPVEEEIEEVEVVDPKAEIEDACKPRCVKQLISYEACVKRIEEDEKGQKHCTGQYFDYWGCIDQCAAPKVFRRLT